jgi:transposase
MIHLTVSTRVLIATSPVDFRRQINGLVALCQHHYQRDPRNGTHYVFINRAKTMIRVLQYDGSGYWLATKRLSKGRYLCWPSAKEPLTELSAAALMKIIKK